MFVRFVLAIIGLCFSFQAHAQTLTISASASTGSYSTSGTNPITYTATGTANISTSDIQTQLNAGNSVIIRSTAGAITQSAAILKSGGSSASLTYKAEGSTNGSITVSSNISSTSNALNLVFWSNFTSSTGTGVSLSNSNISTNGGHFYIGGGAASEIANGLTVPTDYTNSTTNTSYGIGINACTISTNGGSIRMKGSVSAVDGTNAGLHIYGTTSVSSGAGALSMYGRRTGDPFYSAGLFLGTKIDLTTATGNVSISSTSGAIYLEGKSANTTNSYSWNHAIGIVEYGGDDVIITSTTGDITLNGDATNAAGFSGETLGFVIQSNDPNGLTQITTDGGNITIIGKSSNTGNNFGSAFRPGNAVGNIAIGDANSGNITLRFGSLSTNSHATTGRISLRGVGSCVVEGIDGGAFASAVDLTTAYSFGATLASLRIGNASNNQNLTLNAATSIAGDIDIYAGTITLNNHLATTNGGDITFYSNNAIAGLTAQRNINAAGLFSYISQGDSFGAAVSFPITNLNVTAAGLVIGKTTNTADITVAGSTTLSGPVTLYGGNINLNQNINTTGGAALGDILCKASGNIVLAASKSITTSGGDVILWANSDNQNSAGSVALRSLSTIVTGSNSVTGGHVWMGGGSNGGTWNGLDVGTGYAVPGTGFIPPPGTGGAWAAGVFFESCSITTFGGDVKILGDAATSGRGLICFGTISIQTNAGDIEIEGNATVNTSSDINGILFGLHDNSTIGNVSLMSSASGTAIKVSGFSRGAENGIGLSGALTALSTGTGNIVFNGTSYGTGTAIKVGNYYHGILNAYAASGSITFNGGVKGLQVSVAQFNGLTTGPSKLNIGQGGGINSSSSPVILTGDVLSIAAGGIDVNTSGPLTIQPSSNSFTSALTFPITNLTVANTITGLTLGKPTNATSLTLAETSINGPITLYGGALTLSGALSSTNTSTGNISLNGSTLSGGSISVAEGRTLTLNLSSNTTYAGAISGTNNNFNLEKSGSGALTLSHASALSLQNATINAGSLIMPANKQLTLSGPLTNNGSFVLQDGATFKQATTGTSITGTGTYVVEKALTGNDAWTATTGRFWYMGVPMYSTPRSGFGTQGATTNRVWSYSESNKAYSEITLNTELMTAGTGYVHRRTTDGTLSFSASNASANNGLCNADHTISGLTRTSGSSVGFNLISNPYMAYLDWDAVIAHVSTSNIEPTYYIRSHNSTANDISALITFNGSSNVLTNNSSLTTLSAAQMNFIAPLQAIWVRVGTAASTGSLAMTRSMLSHQAGNPGLKASTIFPTLARVNLADGARFDQMVVYLNQDMVNAVDAYDSEKMFVSGNPQIYTMAAGKKLVMNGLNSNKKKISVPLYLELPTSKVYQLQLTEYLLEDGIILLEDKLEGTIQDFTINDTYAFYANSGVLSNRFVLHFYMPDATITAQGPSNSWVEEEASYTEGGNVQITADSKGKVQISVDQAETDQVEGTVQATDANGRVVYSGTLEGALTTLELNVPSGIYYLTVQSGNIMENKKLFIQE
jgi:hypothetical protein